ncbi:hypothetical protein EJV44_17275 [Ancylobacter aquaticus]|nr:hypothetical protein EJV44_17275 [Ancylobacter aquaticus]
MKLSRIEIENFKGIGDKQVIELKPITLLFGPNSAGKSTILQSLHYLREILERNNADPDQTIAGGLIDLGGFATLVHDHDLARPIRLKLELDLTDRQGDERLPINSGAFLTDDEFEELRVRYLVGENTELQDYAIVEDVGLEVEIRWSEHLQGPFVAFLGVEINGDPVAAIQSPAQAGRAQLTDFNFAHPLLRAIIDPDEEPEARAEQRGSPLEDEIAQLAREAALDRLTTNTEDDQFRIAVETVRGAIPALDRQLGVDLRDPDVKKFELESTTHRVRGLRRLLDELVLGPVRIVRDYLGTMTYIGPLREIPSRSYRPRLSPDEARWAQGLAAWDLLYTDASGWLLDEVNDWLSGEERLGTGYRLEKVNFKEVPVPGAFHQLFERGLTEDDLGVLQELYEGLSARAELALRDFEKGIIVAPSDVGVGISQMIPVIVASLRDNPGILAVEQPELHVHPAIQVGLGDLFIRAIQENMDSAGLGAGKALLVETHSEHIMLRLLRRIRETTEGELPPGVLGLTPEELSVIYVENDGDGVRFRALRVDDEGEFIDRWPKGFFEERAEELF